MNKKESKRLDLAVKFLKLIGIKVERFRNNINIHGNPEITLSKNFEIMNHLKENNVGYWKHWWRAMKCSYALWIHAWFPNVLKDYASKELSK